MLRRLAACTAAALTLVLASPPARAQDPPAKPKAGDPKPPPVLVAPKQLNPAPVPYPEGATGEAIVTLEVSIAADGTVDRVTVLEGDEPFAEAARSAALDWKFEPATRDGVKIPARVTAKVSFTPPSPPEVTPPEKEPDKEPPKKPPPKKPKPIDDEPIEIVVEGERKEVGTTTIGGGEVRILPGAFGDPFRAIEALPGVTPILSGIPFFYIRGSPPGNAGYFIDGIRVPMLFHLGAGPSVLAPGLIDSVDFHPGGYPARYGRFSGGVIGGITKEPGAFRGEWNVRLFDASAMVESPFHDGKGTALVAGRYGYPGLLLSLISSEVGLQYWDYQVRVGHMINETDRLSVFTFGAFDKLTDKKKDITLFGVQFHRVDVRWDRALPNGFLRIASTLGIDQTTLGDDSCSPSRGDCEDFLVRMLTFGARAELESRISPDAKVRAGADFTIERFGLVPSGDKKDAQEQAKAFGTRVDTSAGIRGDLVIKAAKNVEVVPGLRLDMYTSRHFGGRDASDDTNDRWVPAFEPRLATNVGVARHIAWISTLGIAQQPPSFVVPVPGLRLSGLGSGLQKSFQFAEGVEVELPLKTTVKVMGFYHAYLKLSDLIATCVEERPNQPDCTLDDRATGRAYGLEVLIKRALTEKLGGWLAYTLSRSERTFLGTTTLSQFDRTHVASAVGSYDLGLGWRFGARFSYVSGRPAFKNFFRESPGEAPPPPTPGTGSTSSPLDISRFTITDRLPPFYRLDVRLEKRWTLSPTSHVSFTIEWFNALLKKEPIGWKRCRVVTLSCEVDEIGPVTIPSLGVEGGF